MLFTEFDTEITKLQSPVSGSWLAIAKVWPCACWQQLLNMAHLSNWIHTYSPFLFKLRISYRLARFPHLNQARRAIRAPVAAVLIWRNSPLCYWFSSGGKIAGQITPSRTFELARWAPVEPKKLDNIFWNDENNLLSSATLTLVLYLSIGFSSSAL